MLEIISAGGFLVYIIILFSILGLGVVIERVIYFSWVETGNYDGLKEEVKDLIAVNDFESAEIVCQNHDSSVSKIIETVISNRNRKKEVLDDKIKEVALDQIPVLEKFMWILSTTAHVTPLIGLLGTVTGMIKAFNVIAIQGVGKPEMLAEGISQALITTAAGLTVAIPALVCYNFLNKKIDSIINEMEKSSVEFLDLLGR
ncbi:MAG: MotA/TolQ/ExbB proton channel family protein [Fusobacteriota bacterium]